MKFRNASFSTSYYVVIIKYKTILIKNPGHFELKKKILVDEWSLCDKYIPNSIWSKRHDKLKNSVIKTLAIYENSKIAVQTSLLETGKA